MQARIAAALIVLALYTAGCTAPAAGTEAADVPIETHSVDDAEDEVATASERAPAPAEPPAEALTLPTLLAPRNDATRIDADDAVRFRWRHGESNRAHAVTSRLLVDGQEHCRWSTDNSCTVRLEPGRTYTWHVETRSPTGMTVASPTWTFRTNTPPTAPIPLYPLANTHSWMPGDQIRYTPSADADGDAVTYAVEVLDARGAVAATCSSVGSCQPSLPVGAAFTYMITASDGLSSTTSPPVNFRTNAPPTQVRLPPGLDGAEQVPLDYTLTHGGATDPDGDSVTYTIARSGGRTDVAAVCRNVATTSCALSPLAAGDNILVTIRATDTYGAHSDTELSFTTRLPIVLIHGWNGNNETWTGLYEALRREGYPILDFTAVTGTRLLEYDTIPHGGIPVAANEEVSPSIRRALIEGGYSAFQRVDIIAHSMGGLVARHLIETPGESVDFDYDPEVDRTTKTPLRWAAQVRTLTTLATPHHGTTTPGPFDSARQMMPGSAYLSYLGDSPDLSGPRYYTAGGTKDELVTSASARLPIAEEHRDFPACHSAWECGMRADPIVRHRPVHEWLTNEVLASRFS